MGIIRTFTSIILGTTMAKCNWIIYDDGEHEGSKVNSVEKSALQTPYSPV